MTATSPMTIASNVIHELKSLAPCVLAVIYEIEDDETYQRIVHNIPYGLGQQDILLIASMLNTFFPPTNQLYVAQRLGDGMFTVIVNPDTLELEWESDSTP